MLAPALERQAEFNSTVVQILNGHVDETARLHARLRNLVAALMQLPAARAADHGRPRPHGLGPGDDTRGADPGGLRPPPGVPGPAPRRACWRCATGLEAVSEEVRALRGALASPPPARGRRRGASRPPPTRPTSPSRTATAGSRDEIRERLASYVPSCSGASSRWPTWAAAAASSSICSRSRASRGGASRGTRPSCSECVERGLDVALGDLLAFLRDQGGRGRWAGSSRPRSPSTCRRRVLQETLRESHRVLRPGRPPGPRDA